MIITKQITSVLIYFSFHAIHLVFNNILVFCVCVWGGVLGYLLRASVFNALTIVSVKCIGILLMLHYVHECIHFSDYFTNSMNFVSDIFLIINGPSFEAYVD